MGKDIFFDTAGMGKTTILKYLFLDAIEQGAGIPIFIELRNLSAKKSILQRIVEDLKAMRDNFFDEEILRALISRGDFIFFFDGYDEIPMLEKGEVSMDLVDFISKSSSNNTFFLSSRDEGGLSAFADFQKYKIEPLAYEEAVQLINNYGDNGEIAQGLIREIECNYNDVIKELLGNPLLVSLLYKAYDYRKVIPFNKGAFYRQIYDALFADHDLSKGAGYYRENASGLGSDDFHKMLRIIGFESFFKMRKVSYSKDELVKLIEDCRQKSKIKDFGSSDFLDDLLKAVPLFYREGMAYKWVHKSFQEYFAAAYIYAEMGTKKEDFLKKMAASEYGERYDNIFDIYYDLDENTVQKILFLQVLTQFESEYERLYGQFGDAIDCELVSSAICRNKSMKMFIYSLSKDEAEQTWKEMKNHSRWKLPTRSLHQEPIVKMYEDQGMEVYPKVYRVESAYTEDRLLMSVLGLANKKNLVIVQKIEDSDDAIMSVFINEHIDKQDDVFSLQCAIDKNNIDEINGFSALYRHIFRWENYFKIQEVRQMIEQIKGQIDAVDDYLNVDL